ncbi:MAG: hypothetical protein APR54_02910 [Candidatus Cloacimonas sp. SDB]|nr:MAG: hypothetical protein APR54_02910 [Candidatus Cloacimonas sp. SDB]
MKYQTFDNLHYSGNILLFQEPGLAVFCSRTIPMDLFLPALDLLKLIMEKEVTVISGWHSNVEKKLLESRSPNSLSNIVLFLAKGIENYKLPDHLIEDFRNNKILVASFWENVVRISKQNAVIRNKAIIQKADKILFLYIESNGNLEKIFDLSITMKKKVFMLDHPSNKKWFEKGALPLSRYNLEAIS